MALHLRKLSTALIAVVAAVGVATPAYAAETSSPIDHLGRPAPHILQQMQDVAMQPFVTPQARNSLLAAVAFYRGEGKSGVSIPDGAPTINQFIWPTVSAQCIGGTQNATGTAIAVPGPAPLPLPGVKQGQTMFLFTALGTSAAAPEQHGMNVHWLNLNTKKFGTTALSNTGINPEGPATINGIADTGSGQILAWLDGGVTLTDATGAPANTCSFAPTATSFTVS